MCLSSPKPPDAPPPPPETLKNASDQADNAVNDQRKKAALLAGLSGTIKTGGLGITTSPGTAVKSLLGQ